VALLTTTTVLFNATGNVSFCIVILFFLLASNDGECECKDDGDGDDNGSDEGVHALSLSPLTKEESSNKRHPRSLLDKQYIST